MAKQELFKGIGKTLISGKISIQHACLEVLAKMEFRCWGQKLVKFNKIFENYEIEYQKVEVKIQF